MKKKLELYIHIPFCDKKCNYCDFLSMKGDETTKREYVNQLVEEIRVQGKNYSEYYVTTVYIGGGTPSTLSGILIANIMSAVYESFVLEASAEISIECNPGTLSSEKLGFYRQSGINRISMGLQSCSDKELRLLGRIHTYEEFLTGYQKVREAGFQNINVDLMSAIPGQTLDSWKNTLKKIVMLRPEHISAYSLIIEEGTPFYRYFNTPEGKKHLPGEELDRQMYHFTKTYLAEHGYKRYEISNYARKGGECRHNIGYWQGVEYLGLGLGSHSCVMNRRFHVENNLARYMRIDMQKDITPLYQDIHEQSEKERMEEFMFLGLRMIEGVSAETFADTFERDMFEVFEKAIRRNIILKLLTYESPYLFLTDLGLDVSNRVMQDFLME